MENIVNLKKNFDECQQKFKKMEEDIQSLKNNAYNNNYNRINIYNNDIDNYMYSYISAHKSRFNFLFSSFFLISSLYPKQLKGHFIV